MIKLNSLSLFVGTGRCNAKCRHCAGRIHRQYAPLEDGVVDEELILKTLREGHKNGVRYLSLSSSGEPTLSPLSVTRVLKLIHSLQLEDIEFSPINLYSNGIRIGEDEEFCNKYLSRWKDWGLTTVYLTVHDIDAIENARIYGVERYPELNVIVNRIHNCGLSIRANLILSKDNIATSKRFVEMTNKLRELGFDAISAWPIRDQEDKMDLENTPPGDELDRMEEFVRSNTGLKIRLLREKSRAIYQSGEKLTLFPNGVLSNTWCN